MLKNSFHYKKMFWQKLLVLSFFFTNISYAKISDFAEHTLGRFSIQDNYTSLAELKKSLPKEMMQSEVVIAYDFTASNQITGGGTFSGRNLHHQFSDNRHNPYETVSAILGGVLNLMDDDGRFQVLAFGDEKSVQSKERVSEIKDAQGEDPFGVEGLLTSYKKYTKNAVQAGPTSFYGPIKFAAKQAYKRKKHTVLIILTDGALSAGQCEEETLRAIEKSCKTPLSIVVIGVGDGTGKNIGEFPELEILDDLLDPKINNRLPYKNYLNKISFDNVQFVNATKFFESSQKETDRQKLMRQFTLHCLQEVVEQRQEMIERKMITS